MGYNFLNYDGTLRVVPNCVHDSNIGYESDLSNDGDVDGWLYYDGIHTYGCWNNYLFGTLYGSSAVIGRYESFRPVEAENYYFVKIVMKLDLVERVGSQIYPPYGRIAWRTLSSPTWGHDKEYDFELFSDNEWHTYYLNLGEAQWWQGDINDLRIYPILSDGRDGDCFFIRTIEILSVSTYRCLNYECDYNTQFEHNCPGIGERGYCKAKDLNALVTGGTQFEFSSDTLYTIVEGVNDTLYVNINEYGFESVVLRPMTNITGKNLANELTKEISKLDVGGYAECEVEYTEYGAIKIYSGNYASDSTVRIGDSQLAKDLNFRDYYGEDISDTYIGRNPASGFKPLSSFKIKTPQLYALLDESKGSEFYFNPFIYSVEGGRRDWLDTGLGEPSKDIRGTADDTLGLINRSYDFIENNYKTIIDFNHPFNASGRITKIYAGITLDNLSAGHAARGEFDANRIDAQLSGAKIMFFRPLKNGDIRVLPIEVEINDRDHVSGKLYSAVQEYVEIDCDLFVNKGDLIGVYNANIYRSKSISGSEIDAVYYQINGKASGDVKVKQPLGQGQSGLLLYARGDFQQKRLVLDIDLGKRVNVNNIYVNGSAVEDRLEYNIARCLDVDWQVDLFGEDHTTGYIIRYRPLLKAYYNHPNIYYGKECLTDGLKTAPDGLAADSFSTEYGTYYYSHAAAIHKKNGGSGVVLSGPKYFSVNGDCEWLDVYYHTERAGPFSVGDFNYDPIAFTLHFPHGKDKLMHKSRIYFKERFNFRSFAISHYRGEYYTTGNADDIRYDLIPYRPTSDLPVDIETTPWVSVSLDGLVYSPEFPERWRSIDLYLAKNPCIGHTITESTGVLEHTYDENMAYFDSLGGLQYYETGEIINNDQFTQATRIDWTILEHEWPPLSTKGYRFYCNYHESTKICEFEVFCVVEGVKSSMAGSVNVDYSAYGDHWWTGQNFTEDAGIRVFVGDTPQYARVTISPITTIKLSDILLDVSYEDVYVGEKGCQHFLMPTNIKLGETSEPKRIDFKNVYGRPYDLYVDIAKDTIIDDGTIFYSLMNNEDSILNPLIGPDAYYKKHVDYRLGNVNKNVAINCPVYALKNLLDGAEAWYSNDNEYSWRYWGTITEGNSLEFGNLPDVSITTLNLPVLKRSKWWKIGFLDPRIVMLVREIKVWYRDQEISGIKFYHHKNQDAIAGANSDTAPHLQNGLVDGSYYTLKGDYYIGFELPTVQEIDKIVIFHDYLTEWENSHDKAGIDSSTALCIHGEGNHYQTDSIVDESYFEHNVQVIGSGIYCDEQYTDINYSFIQDFSDFGETTETFSGPAIDTENWENLVNAYILNGELHITNSGIIGEVTSVSSFIGDFDVTVDLRVENAQDNGGWGCYLEVFTADNNYVRVGRTYSTTASQQRVSCFDKGNLGVDEIGFSVNDTNDGLQLRLKRDGINTTAYYYDGVDLVSLATSTEVSDLDVKFRLLSDLSPLSQGVTVGKFDNFTVNKSDADWATNTSFGSSFTSVSGLPTVVSGGWGYYYDIGTADYSEAAGYKMPRINEYNVEPLDQDFEFTFKFQFQAESFLDYNGDSTNNYGVAVGLLGHKVYMPYIDYPWQDFFTGVQVVLRRDNIGIGLRNAYCAGTSSYTSLNTRSKPYYCTFSGDGAGTYVLNVWDDYWDGANLEATVTLTSSIPWEVEKVGVGSAYHNNSFNRTGRCRGWVTAFDFSCYKRASHKDLGTSIKFSGFPNEYLKVSYDNSPVCNIVKEGFDFDTKRFTIDFRVMFKSLPTNAGDKTWFVGSWHPDQELSGAISSGTPSSWLFYLERVSNNYRLRLKINYNNQVVSWLDWAWTPDLYRWYHIMLCRGPYDDDYDEWTLLLNGHVVTEGYNWEQEVGWSGQDLVVGLNLSGWLEEVRVSSDYTSGGGRVNTSFAHYVTLLKAVPTERYKRYYTMSLYDSSDNVFYGKTMDVDVLYDNTYSYHMPFSQWSEKYYTFFAIDFGQRHHLDIVRSFPIDTSFQFTKTDNILYSNKDVTNPVEAFSLTEQEQDLNTDFSGQNYDFPSNFINQGTNRSTSYIIDNTFYQMANPNAGQEYAKAVLKPYLKGDFDAQIDFDFGSSTPPNSDSWRVSLQIQDINSSNFRVRIDRAFLEGTNQYAFWVCDGSGTWSKKALAYYHHNRGSIRLVRSSQTFKSYYKEAESSSWSMLGYHQMLNEFGDEIDLRLYTLSDSNTYPKIEVWWDNFIINLGVPIYSAYTDTRWAKIKMLNGDGVSRVIQKAGFYPSIDVQANAVGQYNCDWQPLGSAITSYAADENIALGATVSGSSYVGVMVPDNLTNGITSTDVFSQCWGSESESNPWVTIHFSSPQQIYRIKIYHGYNDSDIHNLVNDYQVQVSTDNETFTTIFDITDNTSFVRTHDLVYPVWAKQVRIYITEYTAINRYVWVSESSGFQFWKGAVMREVEVYKYYGFTTINSEDTPIIAIDLNQRYFIESHSLLGINSEDSRKNWDNSNSNFTYSNSNLSDPSKISFRAWGSTPNYDKWVAVKRNTATNYPNIPTSQAPYTDTPDYLKHVIIGASVDQDGTTPNPLEYPWMWRSTVSQLSYDYSMLAPNPYGGSGHALTRSLKIDYPASSMGDHIYFIEGDVWGEDEVCSWRDGFGFHIYIDNVDNIDMSYGYIYLGGFDYTTNRNPVVHRWYWSTISGSISSGWNNLNLTFLYADETIYTEPFDKSGGDPRRLWTIDWGKMGIVFKGKGSPVTMCVDGSYIERNHFEHGCFKDYGLYLHANDMMKIQLGQLDFHSGAIEFFIRPDWNWTGRDRYNDFKHRTLFHFGNVANDVFGAVMGSKGIEVYYGNLLNDLSMFCVTGLTTKVLDTVTHMAFVFSNDGEGIGPDKSTVRIYVNNYLVAKETKTWAVSDDKHFNFVFGGQGVLVTKARGFDSTSSAVDGVLSRLKIHNYCKTDYTDSLSDNMSLDNKNIEKPSVFVEVSKDNVTFHKVGSSELPFFFEDVPNGDSVPIWVRLNLPKRLLGVESRTAQILGSWDIGV